MRTPFFLALVVAAGLASAQPTSPLANLDPIFAPQVRQALELSPAQTSRFDAGLTRIERAFRQKLATAKARIDSVRDPLRRTSVEARELDAVVTSLTELVDAFVDESLTEDQADFYSTFIVAEGWKAKEWRTLGEKRVQRRLKMTPTQISRFEALVREHQRAMATNVVDPESSDGERERVLTANDATTLRLRKQALSILSERQATILLVAIRSLQPGGES